MDDVKITEQHVREHAKNETTAGQYAAECVRVFDAKDAEISRLRQRAEKYQKFIKAFSENFEDCSTCNGKGIQPRTKGDACSDCGGTGKQVSSKGILLSELEPDAKKLLKELT